MAKRKKSKGRRRVGTAASGMLNPNKPLLKVAALGGGYLLSDKIQEQLDKILKGDAVTVDPEKSKMINAAIAAGGLYYLFMHKGKKNLPLTLAAGLLAGAAAKGLLVDFGVITGFAHVPVIGNSYRNALPVVSGYGVPQPTLNGIGSGFTVPASSVMGSIPDHASGSGINPTDR